LKRFSRIFFFRGSALKSNVLNPHNSPIIPHFGYPHSSIDRPCPFGTLVYVEAMPIFSDQDVLPSRLRQIILRTLALVVMVPIALAPVTGQAAWLFASAQAALEPQDTPASSGLLELLSPRIAMSDDRKVDLGISIDVVDAEALVPGIGASGTILDLVDIPTSDTIDVYTVQPGDTVAQVATRFGVSQNTIRWANSMKKTDVLHVGDTLIILPVSGVKYTVKSGDTIDSIGKKFKLDTHEIESFLDFNNLESGASLRAGTALIVPGAELAQEVATPSKTTSKGNSRVNVGAYTPATATANIVKDYFIKPVSFPGTCRMSQGKHDRYAVDLACPMGTSIKAAASGTVIFAKYGYNGGFGNLIIIKHGNGTTTFYAHIKPEGIAVAQGQSVSQGDTIGYVGSTGRSTGPHVHFEVRGGGNPGFDKTGSAWK
jgi:murein DD-endopeptidase MepM/ murein hydrolase activator NlpD